MMEKYTLIKKPNSGGSSVKDFTIESQYFYVHKGHYGGTLCTIVSFSVDSNLEFCFEGNVSFKNENEVFTQLMLNKVKIAKILDAISGKFYGKGFSAGERNMKNQFKRLMDIC